MSHVSTGLSLYHFDTCPYCVRVRRALKDLGLDLELKDILRDSAAHADLVAATGRQSVPVLHIEDGDVWMPESGDIVRFLYERFGEGRAPPLWVRVNPQRVLIGAAALFAIFILLR
ncbi:MAG: glutathione S-transferase N-terminal domain-containing protein [Nannocystaceae bacterium]|nr:glutathione S-transferase N-terminal domain-containing protein [Nannocystaceae bacterium]